MKILMDMCVENAGDCGFRPKLIGNGLNRNEILHSEQREAYEKQLEQMLGPDNFLKVKNFKDWFLENPHSDVILAYLKHN